MTRYAKSIRNWVLGVIFLVLTAIGIAIPVLPQVPFFVVALAFILPESRFLRKKYVDWKRRHPRFFKAIEDWRRARRLAHVERRFARHETRLRRERLFAEALSHGAAEAALRARVMDAGSGPPSGAGAAAAAPPAPPPPAAPAAAPAKPVGARV